jgi:hypothetical protein
MSGPEHPLGQTARAAHRRRPAARRRRHHQVRRFDVCPGVDVAALLVPDAPAQPGSSPAAARTTCCHGCSPPTSAVQRQPVRIAQHVILRPGFAPVMVGTGQLAPLFNRTNTPSCSRATSPTAAHQETRPAPTGATGPNDDQPSALQDHVSDNLVLRPGLSLIINLPPRAPCSFTPPRRASFPL